MDNASRFSLLPAERINIRRMAQIEVSACLQDNVCRLSFASPEHFERAVLQELSAQLGDGRWRHLKAVDKHSGELVAWASWNTPSESEIRERDANAQARIPVAETVRGRNGSDSTPAALVQEDYKRWLAGWTRGRQHIICEALFTEPAFQRRGIGSTLLGHGNQGADRVGLPIFLRATPFCQSISASHQFETVSQQRVDLREWTLRGGNDEQGYGIYRFCYMIRLPFTVPPVPTAPSLS